MRYEVKIIADSLAPSGCRLTTMQITLPRFILAEFNTHRMLSRNSASSRAIPVEKRIAQVRANPFVPEAFTANRRGMQGGDPLEGEAAENARHTWITAAGIACAEAERLAALGVHKQYANRLLEPFLWHTCIVSATEWSNFFALRCHPDAQPEIQRIAYMMRDAYEAGTPANVPHGGYHLPYIQPDEQDRPPRELAKLSVARCARVSYLTHDGQRDAGKDLELYERLTKGSGSGHWSPFEHVARAACDRVRSGNFIGWYQFRKEFPCESQ